MILYFGESGSVGLLRKVCVTCCVSDLGVSLRGTKGRSTSFCRDSLDDANADGEIFMVNNVLFGKQKIRGLNSKCTRLFAIG